MRMLLECSLSFWATNVLTNFHSFIALSGSVVLCASRQYKETFVVSCFAFLRASFKESMLRFCAERLPRITQIKQMNMNRRFFKIILTTRANSYIVKIWKTKVKHKILPVAESAMLSSNNLKINILKNHVFYVVQISNIS